LGRYQFGLYFEETDFIPIICNLEKGKNVSNVNDNCNFANIQNLLFKIVINNSAGNIDMFSCIE
jgi:hypothetical protein